jgi:hypothetical protein
MSPEQRLLPAGAALPALQAQGEQVRHLDNRTILGPKQLSWIRHKTSDSVASGGLSGPAAQSLIGLLLHAGPALLVLQD